MRSLCVSFRPVTILSMNVYGMLNSNIIPHTGSNAVWNEISASDMSCMSASARHLNIVGKAFENWIQNDPFGLLYGLTVSRNLSWRTPDRNFSLNTYISARRQHRNGISSTKLRFWGPRIQGNYIINWIRYISIFYSCSAWKTEWIWCCGI